MEACFCGCMKGNLAVVALEWVKTIETPTTIEVWEYSAPVGRANPETRDTDDNNDGLSERKRDAADYYDAAKRRQRHYKDVRWEIARLIDCNFDDSTKFLTLTFAENETDVKRCNREFSKFVRRLNRRLFGGDSMRLKYLAAWERQKRGAVHYHVVLFGMPYIRHAELREIWGHGFVKINRVSVDQRMNVGRYISKYFSKDVDEASYKQKKYFKSQNLAQPIVERFSSLEPVSFEGFDVVYSKEYDQLVPNLHGGDSYAPRSVRYTKITKELGREVVKDGSSQNGR